MKEPNDGIICSKRSIFVLLLAVIAAIVVSILLTFFITKNSLSGDVSSITEPSVDQGPSAAELRLPKSLRPLSYDLEMKVYLPGYVDFPATKNLTFDAELTIEIEVVERTKQIVLNWKELNISEDSSVSVDKKIVAIEKIDCDKNLEKVTFYLEKYLLPGNEVLLTIVYTGPIGDTLGGLYRSHYVDADGKPKISAVSQMEPTDARMMVPCFDEPQFKANWTVTIAHPKGTRAISNGMEIDSKEDDDWVETTFSTTPRMSSYLLAVFISEFVYIEGATKSGTTFRIWSRPEAKDQTQYALEFGIKALEYYEELYGIPFPLSKQDMVALPDFSAGAMENWGLVTYRENLLLYDPALYPPIRKRTVAMVVAHELAHQWFGNLVTMEWWEDLWLNEGFASFLEYFGTDKISDGKFRMTESFLSEAQDTSFFPDSFATSHPLSFKIGKAEEVSEAFDAISYSKGASVIHMIRSVMTPNNFDNGIKFYLRSHSFSNAQASDLWSALGKFVGNATLGADGKKLDVPSFARQWTTQMGYPILTVTRQNKGSVVLEQSRFKFSNETEEAMKYRFPEYKFKWDVPVWYKTPKDSQSKFTWVARDASTTLPVDPDDYILLNYDSIGFYRVNYDKIGWELIARQLEKDHTQISSNTRYRLISDAFTLAEAGQLDYETVFDLSRYLEHEDEYMPWTAVIDGFKGMASYFGTEPEAQYVKAFVRRLLEPLYKNARVDHIDSHYLDDNQFFESLLETDVISAYCEQDDIGCNSLLNERFSKDLLEKCNGTEMSSKCSKVVVPLRSRIYCIGIENGDRTVWNRVFDLYRQESVQQERNSLLTSLTCSRDITTLKNILLMTLDRKSKHIRLQDAPMVWATVASNPVGMSFMLDFLMDRWTMIYESLNDNMTLLRGVIEHCTQNMRTEREIKQLTEFMAEHPETRNIQVFQNEIATAHNRVNWLARNFQPLSDYFKSLDNKIF